MNFKAKAMQLRTPSEPLLKIEGSSMTLHSSIPEFNESEKLVRPFSPRRFPLGRDYLQGDISASAPHLAKSVEYRLKMSDPRSRSHSHFLTKSS
jgi:hypothetical protein